jgi:hypothetical protein
MKSTRDADAGEEGGKVDYPLTASRRFVQSLDNNAEIPEQQESESWNHARASRHCVIAVTANCLGAP